MTGKVFSILNCMYYLKIIHFTEITFIKSLWNMFLHFLKVMWHIGKNSKVWLKRCKSISNWFEDVQSILNFHPEIITQNKSLYIKAFFNCSFLRADLLHWSELKSKMSPENLVLLGSFKDGALCSCLELKTLWTTYLCLNTFTIDFAFSSSFLVIQVSLYLSSANSGYELYSQ